MKTEITNEIKDEEDFDFSDEEFSDDDNDWEDD
jgi:hypothetical protein